MNVKRLLCVTVIAFLVQGVFHQGVLADEAIPKAASFKDSTAVEVIFETTMGAFTVELYPEKAPKTVANFLRYVNGDRYIGTLFHRAIPGFVIQGGGFGRGMIKARTLEPVENESSNRLKNERGTIAMARTKDPNSAAAQFFINLKKNEGLNFQKKKAGYTVFGKVTEGIDVIDTMAAVPTTSLGSFKNVPSEDIVILSAKSRDAMGEEGIRITAGTQERNPKEFKLGEHYTVLADPMPTKDTSKIEVTEAFSYSCPQCYKMDPLVKFWHKQQADDVEFLRFHAAWSDTMKVYARAFYTAKALGVSEEMHDPLFAAVLVKQKNLESEKEVGDIFEKYGVEKKTFSEAFHSSAVAHQVEQAEAHSQSYNLASVPEIVVNGKYRVDPMRAGTWLQMFEVVDFLINKERARLES